MSCQKLVQLGNAVIIVIALVGCSTSKTPIVPTALPQTPRPTPVPTVTSNPTPTSVEITSFEECIKSGTLIQNTFPRECLSNNGKIFEEGLIFSKTYGTATYQEGRFITSTREGGYLIAGSANGCWILKLNADGEKAWDSTFGQELNKEFQLKNATFGCWLVRQTPDGDYVAMGTGYDADFRTFNKTFLITLDHQGNRVSGQLLPEKEGKTPYLDRDGNLMWITSFGIPRNVIETSDGGYVTVGKFPQSFPDSSTHIIKTDANGTYIWDKNLCLDKNSLQDWEEQIVCSYTSVWDVIQLQDGSFVIVGNTWLLQTDSQGNIDWIQSYQQESAAGNALIQTPDGGFLIAGYKYVNSKQQRDGLLMKTDPLGNLQWVRTYGGDKNDRFWAMEQASNGAIIIMGSTESFGTGTYLWLLAMDSTILQRSAR